MPQMPLPRRLPGVAGPVNPILLGFVAFLVVLMSHLPVAAGEAGGGGGADADEEFFEEEEEEEATTGAAEYKTSVFLEYRSTDVFDPPPAPQIGPQADNLYYLAIETKLNRMNTIRLEGEQRMFDDATKTDSGWALLYWDKLLSSGARLGLEGAGTWDENGEDGFWAAMDYTWDAGLNLELGVRAQVSSNAANVWGWRVQIDAEAALSEKTALEAKAWYFEDESDTASWRIEAELAQYVAPRTGLNVLYRRNSSETDDPLATLADADSTVVRAGLRHRLPTETLLRGDYRWYWDSEDVEARGFSVGFSQPFRRGSLAVYWRHYRTDEDIHTDSWVVMGSITF